MNLKAQLEQVGLNPAESAIYLTSLTRGPASVLALSKLTKLNRTLVYRTLDDLVEKGIFHTTVSGKRKLFVAVPPKQLAEFIRKKENLLKELLPELEALSSVGTKDARILYFEGRDQIRELLKTQNEAHSKIIYSYFPSRYMIELFGRREMEEVVKERIKRRIRAKILRVRHAEEEYEGWEQRYEAFREVRFLPEDKALQMGIVIFDNTVNLFSPLDENFGIQIESHAFSSLMRYFFDVVWSVSAE